jgi:4-amino-4-deoxy-L-arabinose transferase-like glycosyltransferase
VRRWLIPILVVALAVRLVAIAASPDFRPRTDAADYDRYAVSLAQHGRFPDSQLVPGPTAFRAPLFPLALAGVYKLVGVTPASDRWEAARIMEALLGTLAVALIFLIALRLWGIPGAAISGGLAAIYPPLVLVGASIMSESLYIPLSLAAVLAALSYRESGRMRTAVLAGVLLGITGLARSTELILVIAILVICWRGRPWRSWHAARAPAAALAATLVVLLPWLIRDIHVMHRFVPVTDEGGIALIGTYNSYAAHRTDYPALYTPPLFEARQLLPLARGANEAEYSDRLMSRTLTYIGEHPAYPFKVGFWSLARLLDLTGVEFERQIEPTWGFPVTLTLMSVYAFWVVALLAIIGAFSAAARRTPIAIWLCPVLLILATVFVIGAARYRSPADPFIVMLAGLGLIQCWRLIRARVPVPSAAA